MSNDLLDSYEPKGDLADNQAASNVEVIDVQPVAVAEQAEVETATKEKQAEAIPEDEVSNSQTDRDSKQDNPQHELAKKEEPKAQAAQTPAKSAIPTEGEFRENYPFFRGPDGDGITYKTNVPDKFDAATGENVLWKVQIPKHGYNSPIVARVGAANPVSSVTPGIFAGDPEIWSALACHNKSPVFIS